MIDRRAFLGLAGAAAFGSFCCPAVRAAPRLRSASPSTARPAEWRRILGPQRYAVLREASTERPFTSPLLNEHRRGTFVCAGCALPLFSSATKFESGTGWPSFWKALAEEPS